MRLEDEHIVVTGGSGGLGREMADAFVREGANVVVAGRTESTLEEAVASFDGPGDAAGLRADVRSWEDAQRLVEGARERFGPIDTFLNNAGVTGQLIRGRFDEPTVAAVDPDTWETVIDTNLSGVFRCSKAVLPGMLDRGGGRLIHLSSGMGLSGKAGWGPYVASKHGLEGLAETLALEVEGTGVESMTLRPPGGGVHTESREDAGRTAADSTHQPDVVRAAAVALAAGEGENGGRYVATPDGDGYETYTKGSR
jgi:3-oxoacyl-[acyl-carrier protein] reductase